MPNGDRGESAGPSGRRPSRGIRHGSVSSADAKKGAESMTSVAEKPDEVDAGLGGGPLVELLDLDYRYPNGFEALAGLSLSVPRGRRIGVVGPSGCGKSTLLRLITGLATPRRGEIRTSFERGGKRPPLSMVFQDDTLLPWLTVRRNVALFYHLHPGWAPRAEVEERVDALLAMIGLEAFGDAYPRQLSGGMRRRVAFLASIVPNPQLLLLDEPFSSVDEPTRVAIHQQVRDILDETHITTILVTHDLAEAISLSDEIVILSAGPARVAAVEQISLTPHEDLLQLRASPEFLSLYGRLWTTLSEQIRAGKAKAVDGASIAPKAGRRSRLRRWSV
jgi:NitT/TauT family transport system ATP-binding protein